MDTPHSAAGDDEFDKFLSDAVTDAEQAERERLEHLRFRAAREGAILDWRTDWRVEYSHEDWPDRMIRLGKSLVKHDVLKILDAEAETESRDERVARLLLHKGAGGNRNALEKFMQAYPPSLDSKSRAEGIFGAIWRIKERLEPIALKQYLSPCPACGGPRDAYRDDNDRCCKSCEDRANIETALKQNASPPTSKENSFADWYRRYLVMENWNYLAQQLPACPIRTETFQRAQQYRTALMAEVGAPAEYEIKNLLDSFASVQVSVFQGFLRRESTERAHLWENWYYRANSGDFDAKFPPTQNEMLHEKATLLVDRWQDLVKKWDANRELNKPVELQDLTEERQSATNYPAHHAAESETKVQRKVDETRGGKKGRGRPKANFETREAEAKVARNWEIAKSNGTMKVDFAKSIGMPAGELTELLDRNRKRKSPLE